jgi:hypothetical protein
MYIELFKQRWQKLLRSTFFRQGWGVKILLILVGAYFILSFGALGFFLKEIVEKTFPEASLLTPVFSQGILLYLLADLAMRFFMQNLSVLTVQHYLTLPISKKRVIHFLLQGSVFNFFNFIPLLAIIPWALRVVPTEYDVFTSILWLLSMLAVVLSNHFIAIYLKRVLAVQAKIFWAFLLVVGGLYLAHFLGYIDLGVISEAIYLPMASAVAYGWWPVLMLLVVYRINFHFLLGMTHLDRWKTKAKDASRMRFAFLESRGPLGLMMANELKLITRNRRTKTVVYMGFFFALYGLIFYTQDMYMEGYAWLLFVGIFMTGIFMINYGQFLVSWESAYFDGILTRAYSMEDFYRSKYYLLVFSCVVMYLLTMPYVYFGVKAFYINTATFIYNIGVNTAVLLIASTYNKKPIDLSKGSAFNYQGTGAAQFIIVIPLMLVPVLAFQGFNLLGFPNWGLGFLAAMGITGLAMHRYIIRQTIKNFNQKKYINAAGYRERD